MSVLVGLPRDIWADRVFCFLDLVDIVRTHTAAANTGTQATFEQHVNGYTVVQKLIVKQDPAQLRWLKKHRIFPTSLVLQSGFDPVALTDLVSHFRELDFEADSISEDEDFEHLLYQCASKLTTLTMTDCNKLTCDAFLRSMSYCTQLSSISVNYCIGLDERTLTAVARLCPALRHFKMSNFELDLVVDGFKDSPDLLTFEAHEVFVAGPTMQKLSDYMPNLHTLKLTGVNAMVQDNHVEQLVQACRTLRCIHLASFPHITSASLQHIAAYLPQLEELNVRESFNIKDDGVIAIAHACTQLRVLDVSTGWTADDAVIAVGRNCRSLTSFSIADCELVTDAALLTLNAATLTALDVQSTNVTGSFAARLLGEGSVLRALNVSSCHKLGKKFVDSIHANNKLQALDVKYTTLSKPMWTKLATLLSCVRHIDATNCQGVTDAVVKTIIDNAPIKFFNVYACGVSKKKYEKFRCVRFEYTTEDLMEQSASRWAD